MGILNAEIFGNTLQAWCWFFGGTALAWFVLSAARRVVEGRLARAAAKTETSIDDLFVAIVASTKWFFYLAVSSQIGLMSLKLPARVNTNLNGATVLLFLVQIGVWGNAGLVFATRRYIEKHKDDGAAATMTSVMGFIGKIVLWALLLLLALDNLGIDITALVTGLGVGGIAVALAVQNVLGDLFASLSIALDRPFAIGDFIIVDDLMGTVEHIGLKTTRVRALSGEQISFANSDLLRARIRNFKRMYERRVVLTLGVTYQTTAAQLEKVPGMIKGAIAAQGKTRFDRAHFATYGASSLDFEAVYFVLDPDFNVHMDIKQAILLDLFKRFTAEKIEFAYPTQTVFVEGLKK